MAKRQKLVGEYGDSHPFGRPVIVANRHKSPSIPRPHEIDRNESHEDQRSVGYIEEASITAKGNAEYGGLGKDDPHGPPGEPLPVNKEILDDELPGEGCDREVQALQPPRRQPEKNPYEGRNHPRAGNGEEKGKPRISGKYGGRVSPHAEKGPMSQGELSRKADEDVQSDRRYGHNGDCVENVQKIGAAGIGDDGKQYRPTRPERRFVRNPFRRS